MRSSPQIFTRADYNRVVAERGKAIAERNKAIAERDKAIALSDEAVAERDHMLKFLDEMGAMACKVRVLSFESSPQGHVKVCSIYPSTADALAMMQYWVRLRAMVAKAHSRAPEAALAKFQARIAARPAA